MAAKTKLTAKEKALIEEEKSKEEAESAAKESRIKRRELLKECQPLAFDLLDKALKENRVSHAYLFAGPAGSFQKETALLLSESLIAETGELADESRCDETAENLIALIERNELQDFILLDGSRKEAIKKEEIDGIQTRFSRTASTEGGKRVYMINHAENTSISAMNSLLKFLEEPSENVYAVLTTDNIERILPTIRSRCVYVPFQPVSAKIKRRIAQEAGLDEEDVYFLSRISDSGTDPADTAASLPYQTAKRMFRQFLDIDEERDLLLVDYENRYKTSKGSESGEGAKTGDARDMNMDILKTWFSLVYMFARDVLSCDEDGPAWYISACKSARNEKNAKTGYAKMMKIAVEERDRVNRNNDLSLLFAGAVYRLEEIYYDD